MAAVAKAMVRARATTLARMLTGLLELEGSC
jgi:hypothetical protein